MATHTMKRRTKLVLGTLAAIAVLATLACHHSRGGPEQRAEHLSHHIERAIDLDAEQSQALQELQTLALDIRRDARASRDTQVEAIMDQVFAPTLDQQRAVELVASRTARVEERADEVIAALANFTDRLTPSQKQELRDLLESKMAQWQRWHR